MPEHARTLRVAAAQIQSGAALDENLRTILRAIRDSAAQGAQVVVFPETALTGYSPAIGRGREIGEWPAIQERLDAIAQAACAERIWVAVGCEAWAGDAWVNRYYAFADTGEAAAIYDKVHLTSPDTRYYRPGAQYLTFKINDVTVGLQICYDARFPEGYRALLTQGAEVILQGFYGNGGPTWKVPVLAAHLRSRAAENGCFVVASNVAGPLQIVVSQIVDPLGLMLAEANQDREEIIVADLDLSRVQDSEIRRDYLQRFEGAAGH